MVLGWGWGWRVAGCGLRCLNVGKDKTKTAILRDSMIDDDDDE